VFVKKGALVSFIIKHRYSYKLRKSIIATSPQFPIQQLLERQQNQGADQSISIPLSSTSVPSKSATLEVKVWFRAFNRPQDLAEKDKTALKERMDLIKQKSLEAAENIGNQFSTLAFASRGSPVCDDRIVPTSIMICEMIAGAFDRRRIDSLRRSDPSKHFPSPCFRLRKSPLCFTAHGRR
jgi:hypothetical protein